MEDSLTKHLEDLERLIEQYGWAVQAVMDKRPFAYTVGLWREKGRPELIIRGLNPESAISALNNAAEELLKREAPWKPGMLLEEVFSGFAAKLVPIEPEKVAVFLKTLKYFTDETVQAWQVLWPDRQGKFPGEKGADESLLAIQDLDVPLTPEHFRNLH